MMQSALLARTMLVAFAITGVAAFGADFRAGAGKSEIQTSPDMWPIEGLTSQHDPLFVRVLIMDDGKNRAAIVVIDQPGVSDSTGSGVKATLTRLAGVPPENAIYVASHAVMAPHYGGPAAGVLQGGNTGLGVPSPQSPGVVAFGKAIDTAVESAVTQAKNSLQPAKVGFGLGTTDVNVNRDIPTPQGWALGANAAGFSDKTLPVVRIDKLDGKPLAVLIGSPVLPMVMAESTDKNGGKPVTADLAGAVPRFVEQWYGGGVVGFFVMGTCVDQWPILVTNRYVLNRDGSTSRVDIHEAGFILLDLLGERLGAETVEASEGIKANAQPTVEVWRRTLKVPSQVSTHGAQTTGPVLSYTYQPGPQIDLRVVLMRIGDIVIVGLQPELASSIGAQIREHSPFAHTIVVTMVEGGARFMADTQSYERFTYEARDSQYARGAAELTISGFDNLLTQMQKSSAGQ